MLAGIAIALALATLIGVCVLSRWLSEVTNRLERLETLIVLMERRMVDTVLPAPGRTTFQADQLVEETRAIEKIDPRAVDEREKVEVQILLGVFAGLVSETMLPELWSSSLSYHPMDRQTPNTEPRQ
jgi:hypothetical protein